MSLFRLAIWWWGLTPKERNIKRKEFMDRYYTDPEFRSQVDKLLAEEQKVR